MYLWDTVYRDIPVYYGLHHTRNELRELVVRYQLWGQIHRSMILGLWDTQHEMLVLLVGQQDITRCVYTTP